MLRSMRLRAVAVGLVSAFALAAGACGGSDAVTGGGEDSEAAGFVPASAPVFFSVNTDFESEAWKNLEAMLARFPDGERALDGLAGEGITFEETKAAVGPETGLAFLALEAGGTALGLTEAKDQAKLDELIRKLEEADDSSTPAIKEVVDGWTIVANERSAVDAAKSARDGESLADSDEFDEALSDLSGDAVMRFYVDGAALTRQLDAQAQGATGSLTGGGTLRSIAGQITAADDGMGFEVVARTEGGTQPKTYTSQLVSLVPADVLLYASFNNAGEQLRRVSSNQQLQQQLGVIQGALGISVTELADLLGGEAAFYVRQGSPFPEVTLAVTVDDERNALATVDRLAQRLAQFAGGGAPTATKVGDVDAKRLRIQNFAVYYAAFDGKLVITTATTGISELSGGGEKLSDAAAFKEASEAADMPDETAGFVYVNIEDAIPLLENFSQTAGEPLPDEARSNAEPLRSALFYATAEEGKTRLKGFLRIE